MRASRLSLYSSLAVLAVALQVPGCWCQPTRPELFNQFPEPSPRNPDEYCAQWAAAECDYVQRCDPALFAGFEAAGGCPDAMADRCQVDTAPYRAALPSERTVYDGYHARGCIDGRAERACGTDPPASCAQVFSGAVVQDQPCAADLECAPGLFCSGGPDTCGLCIPQNGTGGPCWGESSCQDGHRCVDGICQRILPAGANCYETPALCAEGTTCPPVPPLPPEALAQLIGFIKCAPVPRLGGSCAPGLFGPVPCDEGLYCLATDAGQLCVGPAAIGETCDPQGRVAPACDLQGVTTYCDAVSRTCRDIQVVGEGASCGASAVCNARTLCVDGTCESRPLPGEACLVTAGVNPCFESRCENSVCVAAARVGDRCDAGCPGLTCVEGQCGVAACDGGVPWDAGPPDAGTGDGGPAN